MDDTALLVTGKEHFQLRAGHNIPQSTLTLHYGLAGAVDVSFRRILGDGLNTCLDPSVFTTRFFYSMFRAWCFRVAVNLFVSERTKMTPNMGDRVSSISKVGGQGGMKKRRETFSSPATCYESVQEHSACCRLFADEAITASDATGMGRHREVSSLR